MLLMEWLLTQLLTLSTTHVAHGVVAHPVAHAVHHPCCSWSGCSPSCSRCPPPMLLMEWLLTQLLTLSATHVAHGVVAHPVAHAVRHPCCSWSGCSPSCSRC